MIYVCNSFSLAMLDGWRLEDEETETEVSIQPVKDPAAWLAEFGQEDIIMSAVGHEDTAAVFSSILCMDISCERLSITLDESTSLLVGQLVGGRLPEGAKNFA